MKRRPGWHATLAALSTGLVALGSAIALIAATGLRASSPFLNSALVVVGLASVTLLVLVPLRHEVMRRQDLTLARQAAILQGAAVAAGRLLLSDDTMRRCANPREAEDRLPRESRLRVPQPPRRRCACC